MGQATLHIGDCRTVLQTLPDASIDAVITDPPYALTTSKAGQRGFMGQAWDTGQVAHDPAFWAEVRRVARPGAYLLAFGGTRTYHRLATAIEEGGWALRDMLCWAYGSGFPKSKSCLKPAHEPLVLAKAPGPLQPLQIDAARVATGESLNGGAYAQQGTPRDDGWGMERAGAGQYQQPPGRWPPNLLLSPEAAEVLDAQAGHVSRFFPIFYCPKASKREREAGLEGIEATSRANGNKWTDQDYRVARGERPLSAESGPRRNTHSCVKPLALCRWLARLITPPQGTILDPFAGSASIGVAALAEGYGYLGIELSPEYAAIAQARLAHASLSSKETLP